MTETTHNEIYTEFCNWNPELGARIIDYKPWGSTSIVVWLDNGLTYKVKYCGPDRFVMQIVSQDDINKKFELNK